MKNFSQAFTIACIILVWIIKLFLRVHFSFPPPVKFALDIAPNFFDGLLLPFSAIWLTPYLFSFRFFNRRISAWFLNMRFSCIVSFTILMVIECFQLFSFTRHTFDYWDITASAAGVVVAYYSIYALQKSMLTNYDLQ